MAIRFGGLGRAAGNPVIRAIITAESNMEPGLKKALAAVKKKNKEIEGEERRLQKRRVRFMKDSARRVVKEYKDEQAAAKKAAQDRHRSFREEAAAAKRAAQDRKRAADQAARASSAAAKKEASAARKAAQERERAANRTFQAEVRLMKMRARAVVREYKAEERAARQTANVKIREAQRVARASAGGGGGGGHIGVRSSMAALAGFAQPGSIASMARMGMFVTPGVIAAGAFGSAGGFAMQQGLQYVGVMEDVNLQLAEMARRSREAAVGSGQLGRSAEFVEDRLEAIRRIALESPLDISDIAIATTILENFGGATLNTERMLQGLVDTVSVLRASMGPRALVEVTRQASQLYVLGSSGRAFGQETRILQQRGVMTAAGEQDLERTRQEIVRQGIAGTPRAEQMMAAAIERLFSDFEGGAQRASKNLFGLAQKSQEAFQQMSGALLEASGIVDLIKIGLDEAADYMDKVRDQTKAGKDARGGRGLSRLTNWTLAWAFGLDTNPLNRARGVGYAFQAMGGPGDIALSPPTEAGPIDPSSPAALNQILSGIPKFKDDGSGQAWLRQFYKDAQAAIRLRRLIQQLNRQAIGAHNEQFLGRLSSVDRMIRAAVGETTDDRRDQMAADSAARQRDQAERLRVRNARTLWQIDRDREAKEEMQRQAVDYIRGYEQLHDRIGNIAYQAGVHGDSPGDMAQRALQGAGADIGRMLSKRVSMALGAAFDPQLAAAISIQSAMNHAAAAAWQIPAALGASGAMSGTLGMPGGGAALAGGAASFGMGALGAMKGGAAAGGGAAGGGLFGGLFGGGAGAAGAAGLGGMIASSAATFGISLGLGALFGWLGSRGRGGSSGSGSSSGDCSDESYVRWDYSPDGRGGTLTSGKNTFYINIGANMDGREVTDGVGRSALMS